MFRFIGLLLILFTVSFKCFTQATDKNINIEITQFIFDDTENNITYSVNNEKFIVYKTRNISKSKAIKIAAYNKILDQETLTQLCDTLNTISSKQLLKMYTDGEETKYVLTFDITTTDVKIYSMLENYYVAEFDHLLKYLNTLIPECPKKIDFKNLPTNGE